MLFLDWSSEVFDVKNKYSTYICILIFVDKISFVNRTHVTLFLNNKLMEIFVVDTLYVSMCLRLHVKLNIIIIFLYVLVSLIILQMFEKVSHSAIWSLISKHDKYLSKIRCIYTISASRLFDAINYPITVNVSVILGVIFIVFSAIDEPKLCSS